MTSSAFVAVPEPLGAQRPRVLNVPPRVSTDLGLEAVRLARKCGLTLNPWQEFVLEQSLAEGADGRYAAADVGLVVSRQNGKGEVIVARQLAGLVILQEPLQVYTSHKFTTTLEMHRRLKMRVKSYLPLARRVSRTPGAGNDVAVEFKSGERVKFLARTADSGRGFSTDATLYLDEAMNLTDPELDALLPTTTAALNPQVWYCGSAGVGEASRVFARFRRRGLTGVDPSLLWCEWSIPDEASPDDQTLWPLANPGLGVGQVSMRGLRSYRVGMSGPGFAREYLGVGDWPSDEDPAISGLTRDAWGACFDSGSVFGPGRGAIGIHISADRQTAYLAGAGPDEQGRAHLEILGEPAPHHAVDRVLELWAARRPPVVIDPGSHAGSMIVPLEAAGVEVVKVSLQDISAAAGSLIDLAEDGRLSHIGQRILDTAVEGSTVRTTARDAWSWKGPATAPLVAATLALHGYLTAPGDSEGWVFFE